MFNANRIAITHLYDIFTVPFLARLCYQLPASKAIAEAEMGWKQQQWQQEQQFLRTLPLSLPCWEIRLRGFDNENTAQI